MKRCQILGRCTHRKAPKQSVSVSPAGVTSFLMLLCKVEGGWVGEWVEPKGGRGTRTAGSAVAQHNQRCASVRVC